MPEKPALNVKGVNQGMSNPLVSVIVPAYNAGSTIEPTIKALASQTLDNIEIICVNDGSVDNTGAVLTRFAEKDPRIKLIETVNQGSFKAREEGIRSASGRFIGFCDADDIPLPDMYESLYKNAISNDSDIAICPYFREKNGIVLSTEMVKQNRQTLKASSESGWLIAVNTALWNKIYKREVLTEHIELSNPPKIGEDALFFLSIAPNAKQISFIHEPKYRYQVQEGSAMSAVSKEEIAAILKGWKELRAFIEEKDVRYLQLIDSAAFIHLGVSLPVVIQKQGDGAEVKEILSSLEDAFPLQRKSSFFTAKFAKQYPDFMKMPHLAHKLFRAKLLAPCLSLYQIVTKVMKTDIKW